MKFLSDKHLEFAHFKRDGNVSVGVPYITLSHDHRDSLDVPYLNKAITKISFQFGPVRIVDISDLYGGDCYIYLVTIARDKHTPRQWLKAFNERYARDQV